MNKRNLVVGGMVLLLVLGAGGGVVWWKKSHTANEVVLRKDLPPAPADYKTMRGDPKTEASVSEDFKNQYRKELDDVLAKIKEHPDSFQAWMNLGFIKHTFGDYKGAEEAWLYAGKITPDQSRSLMNLGDLYANTYHDYAKAESVYREAIKKDPTYTPIYRELGAILWYAIPGGKNEALKILEQGFNANPKTGVDLLAFAATLSEQSGDIKGAISYYEQCLKVKPDFQSAKDEIARLRKKL